MKLYEQDPPFAVQVELTEGCNFRCTFCGIQGIREKPGGYKFMTMKTAAVLANEIARLEWNARIEFAMHGEPSINPDKVNIIQVFRQALPRNQLMMTSNGSGFVKNTEQQMLDIFGAGLNILALDDYDNANMVPRIRTALKNDGGIYKPPEQYDYPKDGLDYSPHRRWPRNTSVVLYIADISKTKEGSHDSLNNHCGAAAPPNDRGQGKRCAKPFRELSVRWDGGVAICCNDWRGEFGIGNVNRMPLDQIWHHKLFTAARRKLYRGERDFGPCKGCDALSYRVGLLPDHRGHATLAKPTAEDLDLIRKAGNRQTLTQIVLRPWEA